MGYSPCGHKESDRTEQLHFHLLQVFDLWLPWCLYRASLVAWLVKNPPVMQETLIRFLGREEPLERDRLPTPVFLGFPGGSDSKESICNAEDLGSITGL